jgi:glycine/D-amino acid oxidase-like deaminating enzyme
MGFCAILHSLAHFFTFLLGWQPKYYSNPPALDHSKKSACVNKTIIVGGGVIGFSTAYYLALSRAENTGEQDCIYIVDSSAELFAGASGQATGVLGDYGFSPEAAPLGVLSYNLHKQLAAENNGRETYGFSGIDIHQVFFKGDEKTTISHQPSGTQTISDTSHLPLWLKSSSNWGSKIVANHTNAARLSVYILIMDDI